MQFSAGNVISRAFGVTHKNFLTFFLIGLVVMGPILVISYFLLQDAVQIEVVESFGGMEVAEAKIDYTRFGLTIFLGLVADMMLAGALAFGTFQSLGGVRPNVGECLNRAFARLIPIFLASLLMILAVCVGLVLLIVPGIILACMLYVTVPVTTVERLGAVDSMKRSAALTAGHRGSIFVMFLMIAILAWASNFLLGKVFAGLDPILALVVSSAISIYLGLVGGALSAVCYHDLRVVKEGVNTEDLVKVFG